MPEPDTDTAALPPRAPTGLLPRKALLDMPLTVTVSVGQARPTLGRLLAVQRDEVLTLDSRIDDPVELYIGDRLIARGLLEESDDRPGSLSVRLTEVVDLGDVA